MCNNSLRKVCLVVASLFCTAALALAQGGSTITGNVVDQDNMPLIGAGVVVEGQPTIGAVTDFDGNYTLTVPDGATHLRFSYIGMVDQVVEIAGRTVINVTLVEDATVLEGVVVTALGIKRAEKAVTYNVQKLDEKVFVTREANMVNSLAGKVAGVQINETAAGAGAETKVVMRGAKSISNSNNALYVLDGIPLPTLSTTKPGDSWSVYSGSGLSGDGMSNLNSEDIADMSALVGASAAALYGYKAANGILMLTSRTGEEGFHVSYSNSTTFSSPLMLPARQSEYGAKSGSYASWGSKLDTAPSWNIKDFFQTGYNTAHTVSLSGGTEHAHTYLSAGYTQAQGIIPNNDFSRFNATFRQTADFLNNKLHLSFLGMYIRVNEQNMISGGYYHNPLVPLYLMSPSDNLYAYTVYERYDATRNFPVQYWSANQLSMQNPFWTINRNMFQTKKDRFLLGASISYDITDWLDVQARVRTDNNYTIAEQKHYASSNGLFADRFGRYYYDDQRTSQTYADVLVNFNKTFGKDLISVNAVLGASIEDYFFRGTSLGGDLLGVANLFTFTNMATGKAFSKDTFRDQTQSVFGTLNLGFKNFLFIEATAREDWASQMATSKGVTPFFYPSVGASWLITEMFSKKSDFIPYAKIRASYAEVGNPISRYILNPTYPVVGGTPNLNSWATAPDFQPERTRSWEVGADVRLFKSKLQLAGTYYHSSTYNQVFTPTSTATSGASTIYVNAGQVDNNGVELSAMFTQNLGPVEWTTNLIWTKNVNKVSKMLDYTNGNEHYVSTREKVGSAGSAVSMWLIEGRPIGELYVSGLATNADGTPYVTPSDKGGVMHKAPNDGTPDTMWYAGNVNPDWTGSWRNQFSWKGLNLAFMFTMRKGGVGVSLTEATMDAFGVTNKTLIGREDGFNFAPAGVYGNARNYYQVSAQDYWQTIAGADGQTALGAYYVYDMTNIRLAEVSLGYDIPINKAVKWIEGLNVSLVGRNLALLYCKAPFDPEQVSNAGNYGAGIDLFMSPSTRNIGFSVKVKFGHKGEAKQATAPVHVENYVPQVVEKIVEKEVIKEVPVEVVKEVKVPATFEGTYSDDLYFIIGKAEIRPDEAFKLGQIAQILKENADARIEITGSADSETGSADKNAELSSQRARTVVSMLKKAGIAEDRISYKAAVDQKPGQGAEANRVAICIVK